jgi:hypothetical protein
MSGRQRRRQVRTQGRLPRAVGIRVRRGSARTRTVASAIVLLGLLPFSAGLAACGAVSGHSSGNESGRVSAALANKKTLEATGPAEVARLLAASGPTLARVRLPSGEATGILAIGCGTGGPTCYELAMYREAPARDARKMHGRKEGTSKHIVADGARISDAGPGERAPLEMQVSHPCAGRPPHATPYAFAYGLLRGIKDVVTDRGNGRTVTMQKVVIPAHMRPQGVLVYGLLLPGNNEVVARAPSGKVVSREDWPGSNEEVSCGSAQD